MMMMVIIMAIMMMMSLLIRSPEADLLLALVTQTVTKLTAQLVHYSPLCDSSPPLVGVCVFHKQFIWYVIT